MTRVGPLRLLLALLCVLAAAGPGPAVAVAPVPDATAWLLLEPATGEVLAAREPDARVPMASITKVMTALVALERTSPEDLATVPAEAAIGGSTARLVVGEEVRVEHLLEGLLVASGNDAAVTLARHVSGSEQAFVALMNARARRLGLDGTAFVNPHGLDAEGHHSTVRDLVRLGRVAMRRPEIRRVVGLGEVDVPGPGGVGVRTLESRNDLLGADPAVDGIKTGNTLGAGYALLAHARRRELGVGLYLAMVGSPSQEARARDAERLLDWGFARYARPELAAAGAVLGTARVQGRPGEELPYAAAAPVRPVLRLGGGPVTETLVAPAEVRAPVGAGQVLGELTVRQGERVLLRRDVVAAASVAAPGVLDRVRAALGSVFALSGVAPQALFAAPTLGGRPFSSSTP